MKTSRLSFKAALGLLSASLALAFSLAGPLPAAAKLMANQKCLKCHAEIKDQQNLVAGEFQSRSNKAKSISISLGGEDNIILKFTKHTKVDNVPSIKALRKPIPVQVSYVQKGDHLVATQIVAKPKIKVPQDKLVGVKELAALVAKGPQAGGFVLVDSRPPIRYFEGHIPGAIMMPFPKMPELMAKLLPKDKSTPLIFYCGGFR